MIPKVIHYIWLGSEMPLAIQKRIEKNNAVLAGYEIKIWGEKNMPELPPFARRAYQEKKWAFVSDYIRFYILFHEGGFYLDTDVEVLKSFEGLRRHSFVAGWDRENRYIHTFTIGAESFHPFVERVLRTYDKLKAGTYPTSPMVLTDCFHKYQAKGNLVILPSKYLCPQEEGERASAVSFEFAYTNHLWQESWRRFVLLRRFLRRIGVIKLYHHVLFSCKRILRISR